MALHAAKHPHSLCCGFLLSLKTEPQNITDAIPVSHTSNYLAPSLQIAYSSVTAYGLERDLIVSGYYQTECETDAGRPDIFSQKIAEKIQDSIAGAVICLLSFDVKSQINICLYQMTDNKWRKRSPESVSVETDPEVLAENIIYSKEKLYRQVVDFDEHLDDISLDWSNARVARRLEHLLADAL